jgi:hypothetical protein
MTSLYVVGGKQRRPGLKERGYEQEWCLYEAAMVLEVDAESGEASTRVEYQTPEPAKAGGRSAAAFHSSSLVGNLLYTCTTTEVLIYRVPEFEQIGYVSLPCFNDVHHVAPSTDGNLLVVSTGLEMLVKITPQGEILGEWNVLHEAPWARFSKSVDYRKVATTKPHLSHPNFAFELDGEIWVTRFVQRDAVSLNGSGRRIALSGECAHDGLVCGDRILFTAVDGKIVIVNRHALQVERVINLREIQDRGRDVLPAWCRGLLPVDERRIWVGFTRIRETIFRENVRWVKAVLGEGTLVKPSHIALFDMVENRCLKEIDLEPYGMHGVYSIFPVPTTSTL